MQQLILLGNERRGTRSEGNIPHHWDCGDNPGTSCKTTQHSTGHEKHTTCLDTRPGSISFINETEDFPEIKNCKTNLAPPAKRLYWSDGRGTSISFIYKEPPLQAPCVGIKRLRVSRQENACR